MSCNTQLGEHSHNPNGTSRGIGNAWGNSSVGNILQERQKHKESEKSTSFSFPSFFSFPKYEPQQRPKPPKNMDKSQQPVFKIMENPSQPQDGSEDTQSQESDNGEESEIKGMVDVMEQLMGDKTVESSGEIPDEIPEGAKVLTTATLTIVHEMTLPDGTVKTYSETYESINEDKR